MDDFSCAVESTVLLHGRLYVTDRFVCFYSNLFGLEKKIRIPFSHITVVTKENTALVIPNAIAISTFKKQYVFRSFWDRDHCFFMLKSFISKHSNKSSQSQNAALQAASASDRARASGAGAGAGGSTSGGGMCMCACVHVCMCGERDHPGNEMLCRIRREERGAVTNGCFPLWLPYLPPIPHIPHIPHTHTHTHTADSLSHGAAGAGAGAGAGVGLTAAGRSFLEGSGSSSGSGNKREGPVATAQAGAVAVAGAGAGANRLRSKSSSSSSSNAHKEGSIEGGDGCVQRHDMT